MTDMAHKVIELIYNAHMHFRVCYLCTINVATIFFPSHSYMWCSTICSVELPRVVVAMNVIMMASINIGLH